MVYSWRMAHSLQPISIFILRLFSSCTVFGIFITFFLFCFHSFYYIYIASPFHFITMTRRLNWTNFSLFFCVSFSVPVFLTLYIYHLPSSSFSFSLTPLHFYVSKVELIRMVMFYRICSVKKIWNAGKCTKQFSTRLPLSISLSLFAFSHKQFKIFKYYGLFQCHFQFILYERLLHIFFSLFRLVSLWYLFYVFSYVDEKNLPKLSPLQYWKFYFFICFSDEMHEQRRKKRQQKVHTTMS